MYVQLNPLYRKYLIPTVMLDAILSQVSLSKPDWDLAVTVMDLFENWKLKEQKT